jgi:hypothetical protein
VYIMCMSSCVIKYSKNGFFDYCERPIIHAKTNGLKKANMNSN